MKNLLLLLLLLLSFWGFSQTKKQEEMQKMYLSFLKKEGFKGEVSKVGNIRFKKEGKNYFIMVYDDELYFEIAKYINIDIGCSNKLKRVVNETNGSYKTLTVQLIGDNCGVINFTSSSILVNKKDFERIFYRSLHVVDNGEKHLKKLYKEE